MIGIKRIVHDERGLGFMESLIAIIIAGVACTALLSVAVGVVRESKNNEIRDAMNQYAVQGFEEVRVMAARNFEVIPCNDAIPASPIFRYLDGGELVDPPNEPCSAVGSDGSCERLTLPTGGEEFLYREITFEGAGGTCNKIRVTVDVGMLLNATMEEGSSPRNFITKTKIVGYVAE